MSEKYPIRDEEKLRLIEGLNMLLNFDEPTDFEEYAAALAVTLADLMERCSHCCNAIAALWPSEVMMLSPWMPSIGGMFPPDGVTWFEWIDYATRN